MNVEEWGGSSWGAGPEQDYPSIDLPTELPASANARKKAKRKRKQQQEQQEAQLQVPVRLSNQVNQPAAEAPATKKLRVQPDLIEEAHITQMSAQAGHDTSRADATRAGTAQQNQAKPSDKDMQDKPSKKKAAMHAAAEPTVRAETDAEEGLSTADMAQLLQLAQLAKQHNPDLLDNPVNPPEREQTGSIQASKGKPVTLAAHSTATADHSNVPPAITEGERPKGRSQVSQTSAQKQRKAGRAVPTSLAPQPNADALQQCVRGPLGGIAPQPKPKKQKSAAGLRASTTNTEALSTDAIGAPAAASDAKAATAEEGMADGGDPSDAPSGKATSGKLGRNARLRLKRQLRRQQQQLGDSQQQGDPHDANEDEDLEPFVALGSDIAVKGKQTSSLKPNTARTAVPAREKELEPAAIKAHQPTGPGSQHLSQIEKKRNKHAAAAASSVTAAASPAAASPAAAAAAAAASPAAASSAAHPAAVTQKKGKGGLLEQMRSKLSGGRFRMLNEQLYTAPGQEAFELMQGDPALFEQYHEGFREQTQHWPVQPIDLAIAWLKKKSPDWIAADFGCGDAQLASSVPQTVHSFDLVATAPGVTACNMADVPLGDASVNAAIFCLALMGTDYGAFLQEAHRVLQPDGLLWIAEVRSRFAKGNDEVSQGRQDDFAAFLTALKAQGFQVTQQDASNRMFVVFVAKKVRQTGGKVKWPALKPCLYKRR